MDWEFNSHCYTKCVYTTMSGRPPYININVVYCGTTVVVMACWCAARQRHRRWLKYTCFETFFLIVFKAKMLNFDFKNRIKRWIFPFLNCARVSVTMVMATRKENVLSLMAAKMIKFKHFVRFHPRAARSFRSRWKN